MASARRRRLAVITVDCGVEDNYLFSYLSDEHCMGIFVRTLAPPPPGAHVRLRFAGAYGAGASPGGPVAPGKRPLLSLLPDEAEPVSDFDDLDTDVELDRTAELDPDLGAELGAAITVIELEGEVIWVNAYRPSEKDNLHPGMGVRFVAIDAPTRARLMVLVGRFAYI